MSFEELTVPVLRTIAADFGVDLTSVKGKAGIVQELTDNGVTYEMYSTISGAEQADVVVPDRPEEVKPKIDGPEAVVHMTRANPTYEIYGLRFTKDHPYAVTDEATAQKIYDEEEGFRPATPRELQEYYS